MRYRDRNHAGDVLAEHLLGLGLLDPLILGLARGGVIVGVPIARRLGAELDVVIASKIRAPGESQFAIGAVASGPEPALFLDPRSGAIASDEYLREEADRRFDEIARRERVYRGDRPPARVFGRDVVVVDDGLATGWTMRAALRSVREQRPARLVAAVPVGPPDIADRLAGCAVEVVCPHRPEFFEAVSPSYRSFRQVGDEELLGALASVVGESPDRNPDEAVSDAGRSGS